MIRSRLARRFPLFFLCFALDLVSANDEFSASSEQIAQVKDDLGKSLNAKLGKKLAKDPMRHEQLARLRLRGSVIDDCMGDNQAARPPFQGANRSSSPKPDHFDSARSLRMEASEGSHTWPRESHRFVSIPWLFDFCCY